MKIDIDVELDVVVGTLMSLCTQMWEKGWLEIMKLHEDVECR